MKFFQKFLIIFIFYFSACSQKPAQIVSRSKNFYNKNSSAEKYHNLLKEKLKNNQVEVAQGDTIHSIARKYQIPVRDLITQNNLAAPYYIKPRTILTIPSPSYHEVKVGETLYAISRLYDMKINNLIEMNDLKEPYGIKVGQKIRIAKSFDNKVKIVEEKNPLTPLPKVERKIEKKPETSLIEKTLDRLNHFSWPMRGPIISRFGPKKGGLYNDGINIKAKEGAEVKSSEDGIVAYVGNELKGYGNLVIIKHSGGWITAYAHLKNSLVTRGQKINKGQKIGTVGSSGNVNSPQLYFGLRKGRDAVNPENYL